MAWGEGASEEMWAGPQVRGRILFSPEAEFKERSDRGLCTVGERQEVRRGGQHSSREVMVETVQGEAADVLQAEGLAVGVFL